jgi:hypothetical protein
LEGRATCLHWITSKTISGERENINWWDWGKKYDKWENKKGKLKGKRIERKFTGNEEIVSKLVFEQS